MGVAGIADSTASKPYLVGKQNVRNENFRHLQFHQFIQKYIITTNARTSN